MTISLGMQNAGIFASVRSRGLHELPPLLPSLHLLCKPLASYLAFSLCINHST